MKSAATALFIFVAGASALTACRQTDEGPAPAASAEAGATTEAEASASRESQEMKDMQLQEQAAQRARAPADPVTGVIERAELCIHFGGEEPFDDARRAQIDQAFEDNRCDTVVADGDALKAQRPQDAARIETAIADLRL
ncbi:hypothetical protein HZ989_09055 [Brevundimonas sp. AJA228-03]|uniref:hypothetical protein n=1 Tax=Brevundimonas sp. AJA228-03 TaxID=2752515 RepID=UPI001AE0D2C5|nr:hypothetical protein [Brevundimonas sp. AJA228-03]QTN18428.1 hypothetical protein HZ989_09055 [Brevundimonas sp. AJA228-03]